MPRGSCGDQRPVAAHQRDALLDAKNASKSPSSQLAEARPRRCWRRRCAPGWSARMPGWRHRWVADHRAGRRSRRHRRHPVRQHEQQERVGGRQTFALAARPTAGPPRGCACWPAAGRPGARQDTTSLKSEPSNTSDGTSPRRSARDEETATDPCSFLGGTTSTMRHAARYRPSSAATDGGPRGRASATACWWPVQVVARDGAKRPGPARTDATRWLAHRQQPVAEEVLEDLVVADCRVEQVIRRSGRQ